MYSGVATTAQPFLAVPIVHRALVAVAQDIVRLGDQLEALLGVLRSAVAVGVILHRKLAIRLLDVLIRRVASKLENFVEIRHWAGVEVRSGQSSRSEIRFDVCMTRVTIFSYGMRVGPITPMTPESDPE